MPISSNKPWPGAIDRFWRAPSPVVIVRETMPKEEADRALALDKTHPWWRSLMSILDVYREDSMTAAATHVANNNPSAAAGAIGANRIITDLISDLENTRATALAKATQ